MDIDKATAARFWGKVDRCGPDECWEWRAARNPSGYGVFNLGRSRGTVLAHRFAFEERAGVIQSVRVGRAGNMGAVVCHRCDNPPCVNPEHLFLATQAANLADMDAKGRRRSASKLTRDDVRAIRAAFVGRRGQQKELAAQYGVSFQLINDILRGRRWTSL